MANLNGITMQSLPGSGMYASYINWLSMGNQVIETIDQGIYTFHNDIPTVYGTYTIDAEISAVRANTNLGGSAPIQSPNNVSYGVLGKGTPAAGTYGGVETLFFEAQATNAIFKISNIVVKKNNIPVTDYLMIVGDGEITTDGEVWTVNSDGTPWQIIDAVGKQGNGSSPVVTGENTKDITLTGTSYETISYIFQSYNAKNISVTGPAPAPAGIVAGFGIVVGVPEITKSAVKSPISNTVGTFAEFTATFTPPQSSIISYTIEDMIINPTSGLQYIPTTATTTPKSSVMQNGNPVTITENTVSGVTTFTIQNSDLIPNQPVTLTLVYELTEKLNVETITNSINISSTDAVGKTPKVYDYADIDLIILPPTIKKAPLTQEVLIKANEPVNFEITVSDLSNYPAKIQYQIIDTLDSRLQFDPTNTTLTQTIGTVTSPVVFNANVDGTNTVTITIPTANVNPNATLTLNLATTLKDITGLANCSKINNVASIMVDGKSNVQEQSDPVQVNFIDTKYQAYTDVIESIALMETGLSHIINAEGEKIQAANAMQGITVSEVLQINNSVKCTIDSIANLEMVLQQKLKCSNMLKCGCNN